MVNNRITPEMVLEAYRKTKYIPIQGNFYERNEDETCACAIGAIYTMETGDMDDEDADIYARGAYGVRYSQGFIAGFDDESSAITNEVDYLQGYEDGKTAWQAITSNKHLF